MCLNMNNQSIEKGAIGTDFLMCLNMINQSIEKGALGTDCLMFHCLKYELLIIRVQ